MGRTRCWMTGVEIERDDAWVLDRTRAAAIRQDMAGRLAVIDQLLEQFGPVAGFNTRAEELGAKAYFRRAVSGFVAKGYGQMFSEPALFVLQSVDSTRTMNQQRESATRHPWLGERFRQMTAEQFQRVRGRSHVVRNGLTHADQLRARRLGLDWALAELGPGEDAHALDAWLSATTPELVLQAINPPEQHRATCFELILAWGKHGKRYGPAPLAERLPVAPAASALRPAPDVTAEPDLREAPEREAAPSGVMDDPFALPVPETAETVCTEAQPSAAAEPDFAFDI